MLTLEPLRANRVCWQDVACPALAGRELYAPILRTHAWRCYGPRNRHRRLFAPGRHAAGA